MIRKYDSIITIIDKSKNKILALKFKKIDNKLYAFNFYEPEEKRNLVEVKSINGVSITDFIDKIEIDDLYNSNKMKQFGIDLENKFILNLIVDEKTFEYDVYDSNSPDEVFTKPFEINKNVDSEITIDFNSNPSQDNTMLNYASTTVKSILSILNGMAVSSDDKKEITDILSTITQFNDTFANTNDNLDMIFLSTQLLMLDSEIHNIPNRIKEMMKNYLIFDFGSGDYHDTNNAILTDDKIDYQKVMVMMRNCIAHSNYKVLDNGIVEFYDLGKNKVNFTIHKNQLKFLFNELYKFYYLDGTFPVIYTENIINNPAPFSEDELIKYLHGIELLELSDSTLKTFESEEKQSSMDDILGFDLDNFTKSFSNSKEDIINSFRFNLKKHFNDGCKINNNKLTKEDIEYILFNIKNMGEDHFYKLGKSSQINIINTLIRIRYNKNYELLSSIDETINSKYDSNDSLTSNTSNYIKIQTKIELLIMALMNNIFLFCYNQNPATINASSIRFPKHVYKDFLENQIEQFYNASKETADYESIYDSLLKVSSTQRFDEKDYRNAEKDIMKWKNKIIQYKNIIESINQILDGTATDEVYNLVNKNILHEIRHCLAHKPVVNCNDFSNICNSTITLQDIYEGQVKFCTSIGLGEIIKAINHSDFLKSVLDDNQHFIKHK